MDAMTRFKVDAGTTWGPIFGYSRAVRVGNVVEVAGTTAVDDEGRLVGPGDMTAQTRYALGKIERALAAAGASLEDVVRTRLFTTDAGRWEEIARAHGEFFAAIRPAATLIEVRALIEPGMLIEIEATAVVG